MLRDRMSGPRAELAKAVSAALASFLLFQFSLAFFLFLIPIYLYADGRKPSRGFALAASVLIMLALQRTVLNAGIEDVGINRSLITLIDLSYPMLLLLGAAAFSFLKGRSLQRLLIISGAAGLISVPMIALFSADKAFTGLLKEQIVLMIEVLRAPLKDAGTYEASVLFSELQPEIIMEATKNLFFRFYIFVYLLIQALSLVWARGIKARLYGGQRIDAASFRLPEDYVWPLFGSLFVLGLDMAFGLGPFGPAVWNIAAVMLLLYGYQGLGIVRDRMKRSPRLRRARFFLTVLCVMLLFTPGVNLFVILALPLLGVSEMWIRYRDV